MRITTVLLFLACGLAAKDREWKLGKVLDSSSSKTTFATGASINSTSTGSTTAYTTGYITPSASGTSVDATTTGHSQSQQTSTTVVHHMTIRETELLVLSSDYAYVIEDPFATSGPLLRRAITNRKHGCRFVIGEDIKYVQEKDKLIVLDPDGKECRLDIVKQERVH